ncbi:MAG: hypothetical protein COS15_05190 [Caldiserica bacterium CG02_land_8_20_14_3_00_36_38]|nr:hypothetical protein [Caldisericota bacterium]OIP13827.1 MAG: hypothetical protein AUJ99_00860 [Caldisericum sp. CG2_30_36_11]PIP49699.1 MAG: hypothetical protein COX13_02495 [Caldiserica bacterium CG23_combo_of_CG06-09_8_20_14_all_35_60]PIV54647.1 MAG: hypothetical protein COS15_05190 [Caldiserica bacterium CG02_land_8_20_14_3_00_36_38]PIX29617.1 MAG: hypothetical protein COZ65_01395 [Caldiserica bacterium CG_4_8_14_3_um_filter_35_18]
MKKILSLIVIAGILLLFPSFSPKAMSSCYDSDGEVDHYYLTANQYPYVWNTFYKCYGSLINRSQTHWTPEYYYHPYWQLHTFSGYSYNNSSYYSIVGYNIFAWSPGGTFQMAALGPQYDPAHLPVGPYGSLSLSEIPLFARVGASIFPLVGDKGYYYQITWETFTDDSHCEIIFQEITPTW